jgi:nucleoid-associated protein YgaU
MAFNSGDYPFAAATLALILKKILAKESSRLKEFYLKTEDEDEEYDEDEEEYDEEEEEEEEKPKKKKSGGGGGSGDTVHTVVPGDTLWGIAQKYYGDGNRYMEIFNANKAIWKNYKNDPNVIYPGWELHIP